MRGQPMRPGGILQDDAGRAAVDIQSVWCLLVLGGMKCPVATAPVYLKARGHINHDGRDKELELFTIPPGTGRRYRPALMSRQRTFDCDNELPSLKVRFLVSSRGHSTRRTLSTALPGG
jgi:hypothetical protein